MGLLNILNKGKTRARKMYDGWFSQQLFIPPQMNTVDFLSSYGEIGWLFACVSKISQNVADSEWKAYNGEEPLEKSQALQVLAHPNPYQSQYELLWKTEMFLDLRGKAFWYLAKNRLGQTSEIWCISPADMWIVPDQNDYIKGYVYRVGTQQVPLDPDEVIFFNMFDPLNPYNGVGPAQAAASALESDKYASQWNRNFFYNNAEPQGIINFPEVNDDDYERLKEQWHDRYRGVDNAKRTAMVRGGNITYTPIQINQRDMDFYNLRQMTRDEILGAFGVPKSILGITDDVNRANAETAEYTFAKHVIRPRLRLIQEKINNEYVQTFKENGILRFTDPVPANKDFIAQVVDNQVNKTITINEGRQIINKILGTQLDPLDGGDVIYQPVTLQPIGTALPQSPATPAPKGIKSVKKNSNDRAAYWQEFVRKSEQQEKKFIPVWKEIFEDQRVQILYNLSQNKAAKAVNHDDMIGFLISDKEKQRVKKKVRPLVEQTVNDKGKQAMEELNVAISFNIHNPRTTAWLEKYCGDQITEINNTTKECIRAQLTEGEALGESISELGARITRYFVGMQAWRVPLIARTETITASNEGTFEGYKQSGVVEQKEWVACIDGREREWHADADGQTVNLDDPFIVDGEELMYPGDPGGNAENVCNCRCTIIAN